MKRRLMSLVDTDRVFTVQSSEARALPVPQWLDTTSPHPRGTLAY